MWGGGSDYGPGSVRSGRYVSLRFRSLIFVFVTVFVFVDGRETPILGDEIFGILLCILFWIFIYLQFYLYLYFQSQFWVTICLPAGDVIIGERWRGSDKKSSNEDATDHDIMSSFALCSLLWKMFLSVIITHP